MYFNQIVVHLVLVLGILSFQNGSLGSQSQTDLDAEIDTRILFGISVRIQNYEYMVSIHENSAYRIGNTLMGSASIISTQWAITAAHIFYNGTKQLEPKDLMLIGGQSESNSMYGYNHYATHFVRHPKFNLSHLAGGYDIGLIRVKKPFTFPNENIAPISSRAWHYNDNDMITVLGWGAVDPSGSMKNWNDTLRKVNLYILPSSRCGKDGELDSSLFCAGEKKEKDSASKDSCLGDSGGPAIQHGVVMGIVSYGNGHGEDLCGMFGTYMKLGMFQDWIENNILNIEGHILPQLYFSDS